MSVAKKAKTEIGDDSEEYFPGNFFLILMYLKLPFFLLSIIVYKF